jgi:hypothetical protein
MPPVDPSLLSAPSLPPDLPAPLAALWHLQKGGYALGPDWETAHALCQQNEGDPDHDVVHGLVHLIEGDQSNAAYWYRRAGRGNPTGGTIAEWQRIAALLTA